MEPMATVVRSAMAVVAMAMAVVAVATPLATLAVAEALVRGAGPANSIQARCRSASGSTDL